MPRGRHRALMFVAGLTVGAAVLIFSGRAKLSTNPGHSSIRAGKAVGEGSGLPRASVGRPYQSLEARVSLPIVSQGGAPVRQIRRVQTPLAFEPVAGASHSAAGFVARGPGYTVLVTGNEAALALKRTNPESGSLSQRGGINRHWPRAPFSLARFGMTREEEQAGAGAFALPLLRNPQAAIHAVVARSLVQADSLPAADPQDVFRVNFLGANPRARVSGSEKLPGKSNYFIGRDRAKWRTDVPHFAKAKVKGRYPGIDLVYYGNQGQLEYDFVLAPRAEPDAIRLLVEAGLSRQGENGVVEAGLPRHGQSGGVKPPLHIDPTGDMVIGAGTGAVVFHRPVVYQPDPTVPGGRKLVDGHYALRKSEAQSSNESYEVEFEVGPYDRTRSLVIDPVLVYSSYLGGSQQGAEPFGIAVDSAGDIVVAGETGSTDFPTTSGSFQPNFQCSTAPTTPCIHGFVSKFDPSGASLIYSTYLGGSAGDQVIGLALDSAGNAFVTGDSISTDFPLVNATSTNYTSGTCDAFVAELSAVGDQLLYSSCFAGSEGAGVVVDSGENVYVVGTTSAPNFPVTPASFQTSYNGGNIDFFVLKVRPDGSPLISSTFLGSPADEFAPAVAVDSAGSPYVAGFTSGTTFPTTPGAFDTSPGASCNTTVAKLKPDFSALAYSTYLCADDLFGRPSIALDSSGSAYVAGSVREPIFPATPGAFDTTDKAIIAAYVAKFDPTGSSLVYGTYLSGTSEDLAYALAVDSGGQAYVTGVSDSPDFPTLNAFQPTHTPNISCADDAFVTVFDSSGSRLVYSTFLGGTRCNRGLELALTPSGNLVVAGDTNSSDFPLVKPFQNFLNNLADSNTDAFVAEISPIAAPGATLRPTAVSFPNQNVGTTSAAEFATLMNVGSQPLVITSIAATGNFTETNTCPSTIVVGGNCSVKVTFSPTAPEALTGSLVVTDNALDSPQSFTLTGTGLGAAASASPAAISFPNQFVGTTGLPQDVTLVNSGTVPLTITAVQATGDFAAVNGCTSSVAPGVNCTIGVFFDPSVTGTRTGTLTVTDNAPDSPQTVALSGTGEDFSMALQAPAPTVVAGTEVTDPLTLNPAGGFNVPVVLTCSGAPALSTCNVNPSTATMNGNSSVTVTVTIQTTGNSSAPGRPGSPFLPLGGFERVRMVGLALLLVSLTLAAAKRRRTLVIRLSVASLLFLAAFWSACGGNTTAPGPHTPPGTYTLAVTGIAASGPATLSHTVPLTLKVQ